MQSGGDDVEHDHRSVLHLDSHARQEVGNLTCLGCGGVDLAKHRSQDAACGLEVGL
jgi:hypothetical protein